MAPIWHDREWSSWFTVVREDGVDLTLPGIYEWRVEGVGSYVGQSRRLASRLNEYPNNVRKIALKQPYRKAKPDGFRRIHHALARARAEGRAVTFQVLENCAVADLNRREQYWIRDRGTLNGQFKTESNLSE